ncbi:MAG: protein kinase family protein [Anaerobutyricum soehngenii]|uniref:Protein kinase family protein n=1 Tax=Anaerobutyricum soehngenii TaxID=105843 RepID=A0A6N7YGP8_9FIRM|nr:protein kinase family protein [Anaerobutyricum soehngenii]MCI7271688.1 protein kinase family protein [Anaerobutyricum hallii]MDY5244800.1 protein kinase family protein [Anaerobutyricum soehngenii]MSU82694.1 protein kinase family protein [Anaerobutyricum soehngenii]
MFPESFSELTFYQKKKDILIYTAADSKHQYILKCSENIPSVRQALLDEYEGLSPLSHPSLPHYYGFQEDFTLPGTNVPLLALCMEHCEGTLLPELVPSLSLKDLLRILFSTGEVLAYLLENGILYTDLHPSNLLIRTTDQYRMVTLLDFTYCYYFLNNPNPPYTLRFSYNLSPDLKGQQMLIQELTFFLHALLEQKEQATGNQKNSIQKSLPFSVYMLLETGNHPPETLSLHEFLLMIKQCII